MSRLDRVIAFLEDLPITQGSLAGQKLRVRPFQRRFLAAVYAENAAGERPVRTAVLSMPRKNGKTQLVVGLALCHLLGPEAESRGEVYAAANDRFQSGKTFNEIVAILDNHPTLDARVNVTKFRKEIEVLTGTGKGSIFAALSADVAGKHGLSPSFIVYDELGQAPKRDLYEALDTAMGARDKPTQAAINYAAELGWCPKISVKRFSENPKVKVPATVEWVRAFAAQAIKDDMPQLAALCLFMFGTAARIGEACRMTWADLDMMAARATLYMFKPQPWERIAHLSPEVVNALAKIPSNHDPAARVFGYGDSRECNYAWSRTAERAGILPLTPHCCRHGFATTMLRRGFDVKTVAERGGWKDATTVLRTYAHAIQDISVTDALFDTPVTQCPAGNITTFEKKRKKT